MRPSQEIHRLPRDISVAKWKAVEWKNWLLYYAVPCLSGILDHRYVEHLSHLVVAVYLMLQETISSDDLLAAEAHITAFITAVTPLYGEKAMTFNMHSLLHLAESVRKTGPLWSTSAFPFESEIYTVKQQIKGPVSVAVQIAKNMVAANICKATVPSTQHLTPSCKNYCRKIISTVPLHQRHVQINDVVMLGTPITITARDLPLTSPLDPSTLLQSFTSCIYKYQLLRSTQHEGSILRNDDRYVQTHDREFLEDM
ncbi:hypothetical protein Zmor_004016 [Zophobas morio]|uniref:DUF4218 domain-containing protein n=1 Tax=Zophobas morio TaxID=2755281 RepID=A0AA38HK99_9CUCU|nr:hypothetical protein Zmor_004016 [Zophobas morio]